METGDDFSRHVFLGFLTATLLTGLLAFASIRAMDSLTDVSRRLLDESGPRIAALERAHLAAEKRVAGARGYLLTGKPDYRARYEDADAEFRRLMATYRSLDQTRDGWRLLDGIRRNDDEYRREFEVTERMRAAGRDLASVVRRYDERVQPQRQQVELMLSALGERQVALFERDRARAELRYFESAAVVYGIAAAVILLSAGIARTVSRRLSLAHDEARVAARMRGELEASRAAFAELRALSYAISHNLRAPLRAIDAAARGGNVEPVRRSVSRMSGLIDALLELLGVSSVELRREPVDLSALLREALSDAARATGRAVDLVVEPGMRVDADPRLLRIALEKLAANAVKFSAGAERPRVEAGSERGDGAPPYFLRDNGAGFDMSHAARLFVPFQRLHRQDEYPGAGMGLPVAARIVERHGGKVWARAVPGAGATFYFTL